MKLIHQQGLGLIEIMIALALSAGLLTGIVQIFVSSKQNYQISSSASELEDNARAALEELSTSFRYRGFQGCTTRTNDSDETYPPGFAGFPNTNNPIQDLWKESLVGYQVNGSSWSTSNSITNNLSETGFARNLSAFTANPAPINNSDVVSIYHATPEFDDYSLSNKKGLSVSKNNRTNSISTWQANDTVIATDCTNYLLFKADHPTNPVVFVSDLQETFLLQADDNDRFNAALTQPAQVRKAFIDIYYVANTGRLTPAGTAINGLFRLRANDTTPAPLEIAEGINSLTILYGELFDNGTVQYRTASQVQDFRSIRSVRISISAASTTSSTQNVPTKTFSATVQLRNGVDTMTSDSNGS